MRKAKITDKAVGLLLDSEMVTMRQLYRIIEMMWSEREQAKTDKAREICESHVLELGKLAVMIKVECRETLWTVHKMEFASNRLREAFKAKWKRRLKKCLSIIPWNALAKAVAWLIIIAIACLFGTATLIGCAVLWKAS